MSGILYLIPSPLGDNEPKEVIPAPVFELLPDLQHFVVEELRTVRRYLSKAGLKGKIAQLNLYELNEHTLQKDVESYIQILKDGNDVGLISEAGLPAVADPGAQLVALAHQYDIEVRPFVGPSSLMLALMASGLNGQCFAFTGYLPVKPEERKSKIKTIEKISLQLKQSQIMIETPYRNDQLFADLLSVCGANTKICVAADITLPTQFIKTRSVAQWKKNPVVIGKRPCVFVMLAS